MNLTRAPEHLRSIRWATVLDMSFIFDYHGYGKEVIEQWMLMTNIYCNPRNY